MFNFTMEFFFLNRFLFLGPFPKRRLLGLFYLLQHCKKGKDTDIGNSEIKCLEWFYFILELIILTGEKIIHVIISR